jgi:hypothetical protein
MGVSGHEWWKRRREWWDTDLEIASCPLSVHDESDIVFSAFVG